MNFKDIDTETNQPTPKSSIAVSEEIVCEDEACIGKEVNPKDLPSSGEAHSKKRSRKSSGTSISIGGEEACSDDACIGKR